MIQLLANLDPMTVTTSLVGGMGALSAAIVHLYKSQFSLQKDVNDKISRELAECKDDRRSLWQAVLKIDPTAEELRNIK
jgi:tRNA A37 N6-isopentenylltransferase MiaA